MAGASASDRSGSGRGPSLTSAVSGFGLPLEGARLLLRERRLWALAVVPFLLSLAAFGGALGLVVAYAGELYGVATAWMPELSAGAWYSWLWIAPARLVLTLVGALLFLGMAAAGFVLAYLLASVLAAPFHDALAARVERIVTGQVVDLTSSGAVGLAREALWSALVELRKLAVFLAVVVPLWLLGFLLPGAHLVTGPAIVVFTVFFLPLDYASYTLDRRRLPFGERFRWIRRHAPVMAGFGAAAFLSLAVPGVNLLAMPFLVVAGTLLALRHLPSGAGQPGSTSS